MATAQNVHFNKQHLQDEIRQLAKLQRSTLDTEPLQPIDSVLGEARSVLVETYRVLALAAKRNRELSSAGEWLIDNFYIIQEQIVQLTADLPESYYKKLPRLTEGEYRGFPRTYEIVQMLASISDNIIDRENTTVAVKAFQESETLNLAEMWSIPLMNRLALIARLSQRASKLLADRKMQNEIEQILEEKVDINTEEPGYLLRKLSEIVDKQHDTLRFMVILAQRLQARGILTEDEKRWFDYKFSRWDTNLEEQLRNRMHQTSRLQLSIQNAISSLRKVSETDWSHFVEECSVVERILRLDPADMYRKMDFSTRDTYRKKVEKLSSHSGFSEQEVAEKALLLAESAVHNGGADSARKIHIGYYLMDDGYERLSGLVDYRMPWDEWLRKKGGKHPSIYLGIIGLHMVVLLGIVSILTNLFVQQPWLVALSFIAAFLPALDLSIVSTNRLLSFWVPPRILPKLEFKGAIPHEYRTVVVVPTMLSSPEDVEAQLELLEIRALANANPSLQYALLSDFHDADTEKRESDDAILDTARNCLQRLNKKYGSKYGDKFMLFHRRRRWNPSEGVWMGWERKRGKIEEFNRLMVRPEEEHSFTVLNRAFLDSQKKYPVSFVITLDADTMLPPGSARQLIGAAAHPLNRAEVDESGQFVAKGYGIFQPRISIPPKSANKTLFSRIFSGNVGLDPYTTAVSDIYQDLFGEGVFTGKGLYDLAVFEKVLGDKIPENTILSHDLLESTYLRAALLTDIELFDDYPSTYLSYSKRNHRWIRGDWQILYWLFPRVPAKNGQREKNPITLLSKWKIFDNLRRSLNPAALILFLLAGWTLLPGSALVWTLAVFGILAFPIYSSLSTDIFQRPERVGWQLYLEKIRADLKVNTLRSVSSFLFLPHQAYISLDAIVRSLYRMVFSRENLLEWVTASQTEKKHAGGSMGSYWAKMWFNVFWGVLGMVLTFYFNPAALLFVSPICLAWIFTPSLAFYMERPATKEERDLKQAEMNELRGYARRTWHYFEQYVNENHSWLPPDNVQVEPYVGAVGRTSPTNIGLALVSVCSAYEMGYLTFSEAVDRLKNSLDSMKALERYRGHFFNWYSTRLGAVLSPKYISTVDSGNLAGSLIVVEEFLNELGDRSWPNPKFWDGFGDTLLVIRELVEELKEAGGYDKLYNALSQPLGRIEETYSSRIPNDVDEWISALEAMQDDALALGEVNLSLLQEQFEDLKYSEWKDWFKRPSLMIESQLNDIKKVLPADGEDLSKRFKHIKQIPGLRDKYHAANALADDCHRLINEMEFQLLYDRERDLFSIGYNVEHAAKDKSYYDLLASEARLASFVAIAKGDVPPEHWFKLSRRLTSIEQNEILLSWSGTMFEYLMPLLYMARFDQTMLSSTYENVVNWQKGYGSLRDQPWGFSESGYNLLNLELHYQYRAFGVPGLGLRRGLAEDYVVAPYAGMLALMVQPVEALNNLRELRDEGAYGLNGFYEAVDYTPDRLNGEEDKGKAIVKMYMAHHQGMSLLAIHNTLDANRVQQLFHEHPLVRACELLLQERIPMGIPIKEPRPIDVELEPAEEEKGHPAVDHSSIETLNDTPPRTHVLSNGRYSTLLTHSGTGYSFVGDLMLNRWRPDLVKDRYGLFFYIRDLESGEYWSVGHQPVKRKADRYDSWFHAGKIQMARVDEWIESFMEVCVSPEDNIELRKIVLTNYSDRKRKIEITSYTEVVLNQQEADMAHPAFSNLFVQTEYIPEHHTVAARRRPRAKDEDAVWLVHTIASENLEENGYNLEIETDREKFVGRNRSLQNPRAMDRGAALSGTVGNIKDPILSIRRTITLNPGEKRTVTFGLSMAGSREEAIAIGDRYDNPYATDRVFELASIYGGVELEHAGLSGERAHYFQKLAGFLLYNCRQLRADEETLAKNRKKQHALWAHGISGDVPILVYHIEDDSYMREVVLLLKAHEFWLQKGLKIDLVFINEHPPSYVDELHESIQHQIQSSTQRQQQKGKGRVFVLKANDLSAEDKILIDTVAGAVFKGKLPNISILKKTMTDAVNADSKLGYRRIDLDRQKEKSGTGDTLQFYNGYGGFSEDGKEYTIRLGWEPKTRSLNFPPAPWINVISNPDFGFITTEKGSGYTWSGNSRENKLTPWSNDAVLDPAGEAFYLRDHKEKLLWSPEPGPIPGSSFYEVRHGFGYSRYSSETLNIEQEVVKWVDKEDPVKFSRLRLRNTDLMEKSISVYHYLDWVLGVFREKSSRQVSSSLDSSLQTIFARNHYNNEFGGRTAFAGFFTAAETESFSFTGDRSWFLGRNRGLDDPRAPASEIQLNQHFGIGFEACAAMQLDLNLASGETVDIYFYLGEAKNEKWARELVEKYRDADAIEATRSEVKRFWEDKLSRIQVKTPSAELDILENGWLQYQNIACRMWARTGFYQAGGAYGFRDQLQDASAACYLDPALSRKQILLHGSHQFPEGDVLHWWHPPAGRGIRSMISDDLLWLPYVTAFYIKQTGDGSILDEQLPFVQARQLNENEHEAYLEPDITEETASLYEHCCRAIDRSLTEGPHGLPLIGSGDWNDGMNNVGTEGRGESVWLGFFIYHILGSFKPYVEKREDQKRSETYEDYRRDLKKALNSAGWDGEWYRRAFYDDGTPMGSSENEEGRIDAIAQAWAVISGVADKNRGSSALKAAARHLVSEEEGIIRLLTPPFDKTDKNPGYIKGYIPGVRENGGQYTHAALWLVKAYAENGYRHEAAKLMRMLSPIRHAIDRQSAETYHVEPYAVAADIYGESPLTGMGGWTWYTGSAGWMYRVILESILGLRIVGGDTLYIEPLLARGWKEYSISVRTLSGKTIYNITFHNPDERLQGTHTALLDGKEISTSKKGVRLKMKDDGKRHQLEIRVEQ